MVEAILKLSVMASPKSCKRKTQEVSVCSEKVVKADGLDSSVEVVLDSGSDVSEISKELQLLPIRTRPKKKDGDELEDEDDECFFTPKAEENKICEITTCPPVPRKPKSNPRKRNLLIGPRALFIPSDSPDLDAFFATHCKNSKKKQKMR